MHFADCATQHISAAFFDYVGSLLAPVELDQLTCRVYSEGSEVVLDLRLLRSLIALPLRSSLPMHVLELGEILESGGSLSRCLLTDLVVVVGEDAAFSERNFGVALAQVVEDGVDASDDAACVVKDTGLLHVEVSRHVHISLLAIFLLLQELGINDDGCDWLGKECEKLLIEAKHFAEGPAARKAAFAHVFSENFGVAFQRRPVEGLSI